MRLLTPFGKEVRKLRIDNNMTLSTMASLLNVNPSFLTSVETGRKNIPATWVEKIVNIFSLSNNKTMELNELAYMSKRSFKIDVDNDFYDEKREIAAIFARKFNDLDAEQYAKIKIILDDVGGKN